MPNRIPARFTGAKMLAEPLEVVSALAHERIAGPADFIANFVRGAHHGLGGSSRATHVGSAASAGS